MSPKINPATGYVHDDSQLEEKLKDTVAFYYTDPVVEAVEDAREPDATEDAE